MHTKCVGGALIALATIPRSCMRPAAAKTLPRSYQTRLARSFIEMVLSGNLLWRLSREKIRLPTLRAFLFTDK